MKSEIKAITAILLPVLFVAACSSNADPLTAKEAHDFIKKSSVANSSQSHTDELCVQLVHMLASEKIDLKISPEVQKSCRHADIVFPDTIIGGFGARDGSGYELPAKMPNGKNRP